MNTGTFKTKISDGSLFRVDRIVTTTSKTGYVVNTAWGQYLGDAPIICPLDCTRLDFSQPIDYLEAAEFHLERRLTKFSWSLDKQIRKLNNEPDYAIEPEPFDKIAFLKYLKETYYTKRSPKR